MPVLRKKPITWKCRDCMTSFTSEDKESLKEEGFAHQVSIHNLVEQNREFFMNGHWGNYYEIS
jgi:hypothetical protein